jgi:DNA-binding HxlR family transcriptional regulator
MRAEARAGPRSPQPVQANSATRALNILGDRWTLMILHLAFLGAQRFDDFQGRIGLARSLLSDRLRRLEAAGVMVRERYQERPPRDAYRLTPMGRDLFGLALMIVRWEKRWFYDPANPTHRLVHACGRAFTPSLRCAACGAELAVREVRIEDGPGAGLDPAAAPRAQRRSIVEGDLLNRNDPMLERALQVLGDRWTSHVIAAAFLGHRRFKALQAHLGIASNILSDRLARLVAIGVLVRRPYQARPARWEYRLSDLGRDLYPLIAELNRWGDRWLAGKAGPPLITYHTTCGCRLVPRIACDQCGGEATLQTVWLASGDAVGGTGGGAAGGPGHEP